ncbi:DUF445 domain-containing protein [Neobacillus piezotolerans]|uniref:DUF445 domain-containing protein n=1 Tax=Neobacillus piezotolerans TaxID=2259171 RepID=A0A3D8GML2_9BACI|nr:DUF445 family protein [Neobacillus piezotolerans]RDU35316.1 DUF445 domain-containing protein [Neobacillus piezotolerans]
MNIFITILFMVVIGALIGGFTNHLAIKMLFRPYNAVYIGKWRVPFTPGLIPKRRDELARQMGRMVVEHLVTPESIRSKFMDKDFQRDITELVKKELRTLMESDMTINGLLEKAGIKDGTERIEKRIGRFVEGVYEKAMGKYRGQPIAAILPQPLLEGAERKIPEITAYILGKGEDYFSSYEGKVRIQAMFDEFFKDKGMIGNMIQMVLGNVSIADKIQPEIIKFFKSDGAHLLITSILKKELEKLLARDAAELEAMAGREKIVSALQGYAINLAGTEQLLSAPASQLLASYKETILERTAPHLVIMLGDWLTSRIEMMMEKLHLQELVRAQVETFSLQRVEDMILGITKSELKMITYLGALLGGLIGVFQGIFAILFS